MLKSRLPSALLAGGSVLFFGSTAFGQLMGTVFVDFDGHGATPQGSVTALAAGVFPGLDNTNTAALRTAIMNVLQADYTGYSINITDIDPGGTFTRLVIGNTGDNVTYNGALGVANELDFRNKRQDNVVSVLATVHANPPVVPNYTLGQAAQFMGNTASHELGHVLGLIHTDPVSTFEGNGGGAAGQQAVRENEIMKAIFDDPNAFLNVKFNTYSRIKLDISQNGINVQPETGAAVSVAGFGADPGRAGDAGDTIATATTLTPDANKRVVALGTLTGADISDIFKFSGTAGQMVTAELFSRNLSLQAGAPPTSVGRIANFMDPILELLDGTGAVIATEEYNVNSDLDGLSGTAGPPDFGTESMLFNFALPAAGTYGVRVKARPGGADAMGDYELLLVPEPTGVTLLAIAGIFAARRRRGGC